VRFIVISSLVSVLFGCSSPQPSATCPNDLPVGCTDEPSYKTDIATIVSARCLKCHSAGGVEESKPLDSYANVYSRRTTVLTQIYGCRMPPEGEPALSPDERAKLLMWLVCKAPNN